MSNINYAAINENFPVAGQDNDTQTFRDNFDTIKTSLRFAKEELESLQDSTAGAALLNQENDFNGNVIKNVIFQDTKDLVFNGGNWNNSECRVNFKNGNYQIFRFGNSGGNITMVFDEFPIFSDPRSNVGRIRLELYADAGINDGVQTISFGGKEASGYKKNFSGSTVTVNSNINPIILEVWQHTDVTFLNLIGQFVSLE